MTLDAASLALLAAVFGLAGLVKGVAGLGLPTVAIALLSLHLPPAEAAALLLLPSLVTNLWQAARGGALRALLARLWPLLLALALGTWLGRGWLADSLATWPLGLALLAYALLGLATPAFALPEAWRRGLALPAGLATGLVTAATGVFVLPLVPYLQALKLEREAFVQALGLGFSVATLALAGALASQGELTAPLLGLSALALPPALAGMALGQALRRRLSPTVFRRCFFLALLGLGLHLLLR